MQKHDHIAEINFWRSSNFPNVRTNHKILESGSSLAVIAYCLFFAHCEMLEWGSCLMYPARSIACDANHKNSHMLLYWGLRIRSVTRKACVDAV